ncbi:unnamed protein product [Rotaria sp. Silwood2]|nr:unnamed protein product [Rotaria sp. Silwood2]CAF3188293.1 unnamed protein product [Rotaria sp. Silwood2]CAF3478784.1 unnamed protein product [Rotaria sp. Silwood2]CAF4551829.1 unnamed protein product [Rotaria sp. Silwood2]CAF4656535.1 unnamed protein product [Rotaria sp. Silwood2]
MQAYSDLAFYQYQLGDLASAESSCNSALQLQLIANCFAPATYSLLGLIAAALHKYCEALHFHQVAVDTVRSRRLEENEAVAVLYTNLRMAWADLSLPIPALYWCEQIALSCQLKLLPPNHPDLLTTYTNIAEIYNTIGKYTKARTYYERSLDIQKQILPNSHKDIAGTLLGLSLVCEETGEYKDALKYIQKAQRVILDSDSYDYIDLIPSYLGMASIYEHLSKGKKASFYYKKAVQNLSLRNPEHREQLAPTWNNMGFLYLENRRYKAALIYLLKALSLEKKFLPLRVRLVLTKLSNIGIVYERVGLLNPA